MISTSIIELANIYESSHEDAIVIFITKRDLKRTKQVALQNITMKTALSFHF